MHFLDHKRILINGCSFTRNSESWARIVRQKHGPRVVNLALPGAGNTYIHHATISELSKNEYDMVIIMWSGPNRNDVLVDRPELLSDYRYLSGNISRECVSFEDEIDLAHIEPNWVFQNRDWFKDIVSHSSVETQTRNTLMHMISLQSFLKSCNIPYVFSLFTDYHNDLKAQSDLYNLLDLANFCLDDNVYNIAKRRKSYAEDDAHPGVEANQIWYNTLINFITHQYA